MATRGNFFISLLRPQGGGTYRANRPYNGYPTAFYYTVNEYALVI